MSNSSFDRKWSDRRQLNQIFINFRDPSGDSTYTFLRLPDDSIYYFFRPTQQWYLLLFKDQIKMVPVTFYSLPGSRPIRFQQDFLHYSKDKRYYCFDQCRVSEGALSYAPNNTLFCPYNSVEKPCWNLIG